MKAKINIQEPCTADWNQMTLVPNGKFCDLCKKNVVDFTDWDTQAIAEYLIQHQSERICGRVKKTQLQESINIEEAIAPILHWNTSSLKKVAAIVVASLGLAIASCNNTNSTTNSSAMIDTQTSQNIKQQNPPEVLMGAPKIDTPQRITPIDDDIQGGIGLMPDPEPMKNNPIIPNHESFELGEIVYVESPNDTNSPQK